MMSSSPTRMTMLRSSMRAGLVLGEVKRFVHGDLDQLDRILEKIPEENGNHGRRRWGFLDGRGYR